MYMSYETPSTELSESQVDQAARVRAADTELKQAFACVFVAGVCAGLVRHYLDGHEDNSQEDNSQEDPYAAYKMAALAAGGLALGLIKARWSATIRSGNTQPVKILK
jgi:hypothetical protein